MKNIKNYLLTVLCLTVWSAHSASFLDVPRQYNSSDNSSNINDILNGLFRKITPIKNCSSD